jgi:hypothetical protein
MHAVEIRLPASDLSARMAEMRIWLDQHRFELSNFVCRDGEHDVLISLEFTIALHAEKFARQFGGRADGSSADAVEEEATGEVLGAGLSPRGIVG